MVVGGVIVADGAWDWDLDLDMDIHTTVVITVVIMDTLITAVIMPLALHDLQDMLNDAQDVPQELQDAIETKLVLKDVAQKN